MDKSNWGVHEHHCCYAHGCKYGNEDCPVADGSTKQLYSCEWCTEDEEVGEGEFICYLNGNTYGRGGLKYMQELFVDYVVTCKMYGRKQCEFKIVEVEKRK